MAKKGTGPALDQLLCERVAAVVSKYTGGTFARERVLTALREVLDSATLSDEEAALRREKRAEGLSGQELLNCLIGARVERALQAALEAALGSADSAHMAELPRIVVLRGEIDLSGLDIPDAESGERARETLILTDRNGMEQLTTDPASMSVGSVRAVQVFGDDDEPSDGSGPTVTLPSGAEAASHSAELHDLAATLSVHMGERPSGAPPPPPGPKSDWTGRTLAGKYEIVRLLGRGGFGAVYQARDRVLGTGVAIKVLNPGAARSRADLEAFKNEARRVTRLDHPNIVGWKVFDELPDGTLYFVMELIQGEELEDTLERDKVLAPRRVARLLLQIVDALRAAHHLSENESILHLDLKPRNVFLIKGTTEGGTDERAKVIDFGIGQYLDRLAPVPEPALEPEPETKEKPPTKESDSTTPGSPRRPTRPGSASASSYLSGSEVGGTMVSVRRADLARAVDEERTTHVTRCTACTPEYASPEQCEHMDPTAQIAELDGRSDIYSLGVVGFRMLTGELPFKRPKKRRGWLELQRFAKPRRVRDVNPRVPKALARFIDSCLEKDRDARPDSNTAYEALYEVVHPKAKTLQTVAVVVLIGALIGAVAWFNREHPISQVTARHVDGAQAISEPLHLGPGRGEVLVKIADPEGHFSAPSVDLVNEAGASLAPLLSASWAGDDTLRIRATEQLLREKGRTLQTGRLTLFEGGRRAESQPLELDYLGPEWLSVFSVGVPNLGDQDLDPRRQQLRIELRCADPAGLVVRAKAGEHDLRIVPYTQSNEQPPEGHVLFGALLDDLAKLQTGEPVEAAVDVEVEDQAGNVFRPMRPFTARIDARDLAIVGLRMQDTKAGQGAPAAAISPVNRRYLLYPETRPRLELVTNRTAEVEIALVAEGERQLDSTIRVGTMPEGHASEGALVGFDFAPVQYLAAGEKTLSGEVRVQVRDRDILRERRQDVPPRELLFTFTEEKADFQVRIDGRATSELRTSARGPLALEVTRIGGVASEVRLSGRGPHGALPTEKRALGLSDSLQTFALPIESEGVYEVELSSYRSEGGEIGTQVDHTERVRVVVDRTPPALALAGALAAGALVVSKDHGSEPLELSRGGASAADESVSLAWTLDGNALADPAAHGLPATLGAVPVAWSLPSGADGHHTLEVRGRDDAGNASELAASIEWTVALEPPGLVRWIAPKLGRWSSDDSGLFHVEIELADPNGIGAVTGSVSAADTELEEQLAFVADAARPGVWTAETPLSPEWSHREVEIAVVASDGVAPELENDPPFACVRSLGEVVRAYPERVARAQGDRTPMRLIRRNRELAYEFKGREDAVENEAFAKCGLPAYSKRNERRSWRLDYPAGAIDDFYLDEHEVTNGQYRAFMRATGHSGPPYLSDPSYALALDDEPVVLVTWGEAAAYAAWAKKRLPSYVEWEYAVRGGPLRYRLYSTWTPERASPPPPDEIVAAPAFANLLEASYTKHAAGSSSDVTPEGVRDLCGNVAEWTATPLYFGKARPTNLMAYAREHKDAYLKPWSFTGWESQPEYWIVGGAYDLPGTHFARTDQRARDARLLNAGFRCAQDAETVLLGTGTKGSEYVEVQP